jgi:hypothetical protein
MKTRFDGYIHSIVGHQLMVSPNGSGSEQHKCALDDFESIMPTGADGRFTFHVKRDRIGVEHYRRWLGLAKMENDRLENLENGLLKLIDQLQPARREPAGIASPEDFAAAFFDPDKASA